MITCFLMDKTQKERWLPVLFDLYYKNMHQIAPTGLSYQEERTNWLSEVSPALDKDPRQIMLCLNECDLLGYIQYYTRGPLLMIEEVQMIPAYHRTLLFHRMCKYLHSQLPQNIEKIEAYADIRNTYSRNIMNKMGFRETNEATYPGLVHLRADACTVVRHFIRAK